MERESFVFYRSFHEAISEIEDKALRMDCFNAIVKYGLYGIEPEDDNPMVQMVFKLVKPQLDANNKRYENGRKGAEFGKLGGRPRKIPIGDNDKNPLGVSSDTPNVNVNVNVNDNVNENVKDKKEKSGTKTTRFTPPTVDEVREYCNERQNQVDANRFVDFYASKGWKVGSQSMKDWKACVRTWERRDAHSSGKVSSFNNFNQNQYDYSELERQLLDN